MGHSHHRGCENTKEGVVATITTRKTFTASLRKVENSAKATVSKVKLSASNAIQKIGKAATVRVLKVEESSLNLMDKNKQLKE